jgi:protocatechuate 3,4-dioxygenase beta subunit
MRSSGKRYWRLAVIMLLVLTALAIAAPAAFAVNEGTITGTVTQGLDRPATLPGTPAVNVYVYLYNATVSAGVATPVGAPIDWTQTDAAGKYQFDMVPGDSYYAVQFRETTVATSDHARTDARWVPVWWNSVAGTYPLLMASLYNPGWNHADPLYVPYNTTVTADSIMMARDWITGTVTDTAAAAVANVEVYVWDTASHPGYATEQAWLQAIWENQVQPDALTAADGSYTVTGLLPTTGPNATGSYKVFFFPPNLTTLAPEWWNDVAFNNYGAATQLAAPWNATIAAISPVLAPPAPGAIYGSVDQYNGWSGLEEDAVGVEVWLYDANGTHIATTTTGPGGQYSFVGVVPGFYKVKFLGPQNVGGNSWADYFDSWYTANLLPSEDFPVVAETFATASWVQVNPAADTHYIYGLLYPITNLYRFVHPPYGVNDGPDRYDTTVDFMGWGLNNHVSVALVSVNSPYFYINQLGSWGHDNEGLGWMHLNLATPKAPEGSYRLVYSFYTPSSTQIQSELAGFQVVSSWVPTVPATPPSPTEPTPTTPTTPTTPVVTPAPQPTTPATPVAGPVTVVASKASVKKGALATLRFQVNEAVLGGTSDVKVVIFKAGKTVKSVKSSVTMNAAASISFRCKLAKGTYSYTVTASGATASSTLTVR